MSVPLTITARDHPATNSYVASRSDQAIARPKPLLVVVEGVHDIEFLRHISRILHQHDAAVVDLESLERAGHLVFVPQGGGDLVSWANRLAPLGHPEFHLYDRETGATTETRRRAVKLINERINCQAFVTAKRALENYLHPAAIFEARGIDIRFGDCDDVAAVVAGHIWQRAGKPIDWINVPLRARHRVRGKVKRWLNIEAVARMTRERLTQRDPQNELLSWLEAIKNMASL